MGFIKAIFRRIKWRIFLARLRFRYWLDVHYRDAKHCHFVCNICGIHCQVPFSVMSRETTSCYGCGSTIRYRSVTNALLTGLNLSLMPLPSLPVRKSIVGIGMSDSDIYAKWLQRKFSFRNTYYHKEPLLNILNVNGYEESCADFIICSDVLEHVCPPVSLAFQNLFRLLKRRGVLVVTVPLVEDAHAKEHFPRLSEYHFEVRGDRKVLINRTANGSYEEFNELVFHDGQGETLEMRVFSKDWVLNEMTRAGFSEIEVMDREHPEFGILWRDNRSVPILAWK